MTVILYEVNLGTPNAGDGDPLRTAMSKINKNFAILSQNPTITFEIKTVSFTAESFKTYLIDTSQNPITGTLPLNPVQGDTIRFIDSVGSFSVNNFTVGRNGKKIGGFNADIVLSTNWICKTYQYINTTIGWVEL